MLGQKLVGMGVGKVNNVHVVFQQGNLCVLILSYRRVWDIDLKKLSSRPIFVWEIKQKRQH